MYGAPAQPGAKISDPRHGQGCLTRLYLPLLVLGAIATVVPPPAAGQLPGSVSFRLGAVGSSDLVRDSIVEALAVRPQVAPQLGLRAVFPAGGRWLVGGQLSVSRSNLRAETDTAAATVTALTVWAPSLVVRTSLRPWLAVEARLGALLYDPASPEGTLFSGGSPVAPMLGLGLAVERPLTDRFLASLFLDYDAHRFSTTALEQRGFSGATTVHRVAAGLSLAWEFDHAAP